MQLTNKMATIAGVGLFSMLCGLARADGLGDLKTALARLQGQTPLKALVETRTWNRQGEGKDAEERHGQASVAIEDGARGLQVLFGKDLLARMEVEERAKAKDPKSKTPTISALREVGSNELRPMVSAASSLARELEKAVFKGEKPETYNGKPARLLTFDMPIDNLTERERKYVKKFTGTLDIWIGTDGTPLASSLHQNASGSIFIIINFEAKNDDENVYSLVGDRLVTLRKETKSSASGAGERGESLVVKILQLQS